jgi:hypothetical protein
MPRGRVRVAVQVSRRRCCSSRSGAVGDREGGGGEPGDRFAEGDGHQRVLPLILSAVSDTTMVAVGRTVSIA